MAAIMHFTPNTCVPVVHVLQSCIRCKYILFEEQQLLSVSRFVKNETFVSDVEVQALELNVTTDLWRLGLGVVVYSTLLQYFEVVHV